MGGNRGWEAPFTRGVHVGGGDARAPTILLLFPTLHAGWKI